MAEIGAEEDVLKIRNPLTKLIITKAIHKAIKTTVLHRGPLRVTGTRILQKQYIKQLKISLVLMRLYLLKI